MNFESLSENFFWVVFVIVLGGFAWKMWKNGGMRGAMFGSRVESLVGEISGEKVAMHSLKIRVYKLQGSEGNGTIGVELVAKSFASYQMTPITLNRESALQLAELLRAASDEKTKAF